MGQSPQRPVHRRPLHVELSAASQPPAKRTYRPVPAEKGHDGTAGHAGEEAGGGKPSGFQTLSS